MKLPIFIILSVLASIAGAWTIENKIYIGESIENFIWPQDSKDLTTFSSQQKVIFYRSYFENFTHAIADQLKNVKELTFWQGNVLQVQLTKNIEKLSIEFSKTKNVEIDPSDEYAIVEMMVVYCELTSIPKYTNRLRRLAELYLYGNKIESVKMTDFNGLDNLEQLRLDENGIKTLSSESTIHLPKLSRLDLDENTLREINVCSWDMPTLEKFYLHENKLKSIVNLVDQFPKLSAISIWDNPLVCQWKDNLLRSLESKNISQARWNGEATCNSTDETHVPIECPLVYSLSNQLSGLLERQRSFEQSMGNSSKYMESLEQTLKKSTEESKTFRQSMETFKQHSLAKQTGLEKTVAMLTDQLTKSSKEIVTLQQMTKKSNEENKSIKQTVETLSDQHQRLAEKSTEEIQSLTDKLTKSSTEIVSLQQMTNNSNDENQSLKQTVETLTDQLTKLRHSIDDLTEGFYRYVLEKEGDEK